MIDVVDATLLMQGPQPSNLATMGNFATSARLLWGWRCIGLNAKVLIWWI